MNKPPSVMPLPNITTEYNAFVFVRMMYWARSAVNRWADQSAYGFSSSGSDGKLPSPSFLASFWERRKIMEDSVHALTTCWPGPGPTPSPDHAGTFIGLCRSTMIYGLHSSHGVFPALIASSRDSYIRRFLAPIWIANLQFALWNAW